MKTDANVLDLSALPPAARREVRDFYQFLLSRNQGMSGDAVEHDHWFSDQVEQAVLAANDPATQFIPHEAVRTRWTEKKMQLQPRVTAEKKS
ncbi:MAG TPA: hypothetical protein VFR01_00125 [Geobacterales bacterium]|nr:hypothetical protein [Geobacterales bacterium]